MCNAALRDFEAALADAEKCLELCPSFAKGYFRKASAQIHLGLFDEAEMTITAGITTEGVTSKSEFSKLTRLLISKKTSAQCTPALAAETGEAPRRHHTSKDFAVGDEIGVGNFTQIVKATLKSTGSVFALKVIQKSEVDRMKRRHPNIHNEISMEKRALGKLRHPGIVTLFSTFQDFYTLYFQMEHCEGGELWARLEDHGCMVGAPESLVKFWMAEVAVAVEYMHSCGIVHRDLKPGE